MPLFPVCAGGGAVATLDLAAFRLQFPAFATSPADPVIQAYFAMAGEVWLRNDGTGVVRTVALQTQLMYLLTAHLLQLFTGPDGNDPSGLVGRINSATEGSVTVSAEYESTMNSTWFDQTPYGAAFWQATAAFRLGGHYIRGPNRFGTGYTPGRGCRAF